MEQNCRRGLGQGQGPGQGLGLGPGPTRVVLQERDPEQEQVLAQGQAQPPKTVGEEHAGQSVEGPSGRQQEDGHFRLGQQTTELVPKLQQAQGQSRRQPQAEEVVPG